MSHFTVLVIGSNVEEQLAPYHEFECTGIDDEYVQDIDKTAEALAAFKKETTKVYKSPTGKIQRRFTKKGNWNMRFFRKATEVELAEIETLGPLGDTRGDLADGRAFFTEYSKDYRNNTIYVQHIFKGWKETTVKTSTVESFAEWAEGYYGTKIVKYGQKIDLSKKHKYGYILLAEDGTVAKVVDRTNPNKKWDGYQIGGRWNGFFKLKPAAVGTSVVGVGSPGLQGYNLDYKAPGFDRADVCEKGQVDFDGMRDEAGEKARERYDLFTSVTAGLPAHQSWKDVCASYGIDLDADKPNYANMDQARTCYNTQPVVQALRKNDATVWFEADDFLKTQDEYVQAARNRAISTYAMLYDGVWYSKGRMGWFGVSHDEMMTQEQWNEEITKLIDGLPDETMLTIVDCHI